MGRPRTPLGAHGEISVRRHDTDGRTFFEARVWIRDADGVRRSVRKRAASAAAARRLLQQALTERRAAVDAELRLTDPMRRLLEAYLEQQRERDLRPSTMYLYERAVANLVVPRIGSLSIAEATPARLDAFVRRVTREHGAASAKSARSVLSGALGVAVRYGLLSANPVRDVGAIRQNAKGATAIASDELDVLRTAIAGDARLQELDVVDLIEFMIGTGVRIGEACAVRWSNLDLDRGEVTIAGTVVRVAGEGLRVQSDTKTGRDRTLALPLWLQEMLLRRHVDQPANDHGLVFPSPRGGIRDPSNTNRVWRDATSRLGLGQVTFHAFRKSVATILDGAGLSARDIADQLGHAHVSMTQDVYMARRTNTRRAAVELERVAGRHEG